MQANIWIKNMEKNLKVLDHDSSEILLHVEKAINFGQSILIQNVESYVDSSLYKILRTKIAGKSIRLYLTSKLQNPSFSPDLSALVSVVNFTVTEIGLEEQLLSVVVSKEEEALESEKYKVIQEESDGINQLAELEDQILALLQSSKGSLLDDEVLINALNHTKVTSEKIKEQLKALKENTIKIDILRNIYRPVSVRASILYFVLTDLMRLDHMYQYSLESYIDLFKESISKSKEIRSLNALNDRINAIINFHTESVYKSTCRGLFDRHKTIFAFIICFRKLKSESRINLNEYKFFLSPPALDHSFVMSLPAAPDWFEENLWEKVCLLETLPCFKNLTHSFEQHMPEWQSWFKSDANSLEKVFSFFYKFLI